MLLFLLLTGILSDGYFGTARRFGLVDGVRRLAASVVLRIVVYNLPVARSAEDSPADLNLIFVLRSSPL